MEAKLDATWDANPLKPRMGLLAYGAQDAHREMRPEAADARLRLLRSFTGTPEATRHQVSYQLVPTERKAGTQGVLLLRVLPVADLLSGVDLVLPLPPGSTAWQPMLHQIDFIAGGQRIDTIRHAGTTLELTAQHFRTPITVTGPGGLAFLPLNMACLTAFSAICPLLGSHELVVRVEFAPGHAPSEADMARVCLYGNLYYLSDPEVRRELSSGAYEVPALQHQFSDTVALPPGVELKLKLNFNHPVRVLYMFGFAPGAVTHVALVLNRQPFWQGPMAALRHLQAKLGHGDVGACALFLSHDDFGACTNCHLNMSRLDDAELRVTCGPDAPPGGTLTVLALGTQQLRCMAGMVALQFSK